MQSLKFNTSAWHYHVVRFGGFDKDKKATDICSYTRRFILGSLVLLLIGALVCLVLTPIVVFVAHFFPFFAQKIPKTFIDICEIVCGVYALALLLIGAFFGGRKLIDLAKEKMRQARFAAIANGTYTPKVKKEKEPKPPPPPKEPGMLVEMYKAYKRKYCVKIEIQ